MEEKVKIQLEIAERLKVFAKNNFGSLKNLADEIGMSQQSLQKYSSGTSTLGGLYLRKLALLGCDINWLLTGDTQNPASKIDKDKLDQLLNEIRGLTD